MTLDDEVKDALSAYCPRCKQFSEFSYIGAQVYRKDNIKKRIELYNCGNCQDTLGLGTIKYYNIKRAMEKDGA